MKSIQDILIKFNPLEDKYISREYQAYGIYLSEQLNDYSHKSLYIKMAKNYPRAVLERALSYCKDARGSNRKGALFMWKLTEMGVLKKRKGESK
ncbi:hypothetical protein HYT02_05800 [Candidatus Gottesmanbacteria bacterium]|nr:hypothetical protein [Candidatus Gottesmanbacteria bacterium]